MSRKRKIKRIKFKRPKRKKGSLGKQKGAQYERSVCQRLSLWVTNRTRDDCFWRSAMSGGRQSVRLKKCRHEVKKIKADSQAGDISAVDAKGVALLRLFTIECKFYKSLQVDLPVYGRKGNKNSITGFWTQAKNQTLAKHEPMLIARENNRPDLLCTSQRGAKILRIGGKRLKETCRLPKLGMHVFLLRDILADCNFTRIRKARKSGRIAKL